MSKYLDVLPTTTSPNHLSVTNCPLRFEHLQCLSWYVIPRPLRQASLVHPSPALAIFYLHEPIV